MNTFALYALLGLISAQNIIDPAEIRQTIDELPVTCSSSIRLQNTANKFFLFSQKMNYGSGSGQQIVTCKRDPKDAGGLWTLKEGDYNEDAKIDQASKMCRSGEPMKCGEMIRLEHATTGSNLHSHTHQSPLSRQNEISGFGEDGDGDASDNWIIECIDKSTNLKIGGSEVIYGNTIVQLRHQKTQGLAECQRTYEYT